MLTKLPYYAVRCLEHIQFYDNNNSNDNDDHNKNNNKNNNKNSTKATVSKYNFTID